MRHPFSKTFLLLLFLALFGSVRFVNGQSTGAGSGLDYQELKGLLSKPGQTAQSRLSTKGFRITSRKKQPDNTIYAYRNKGNSSQILVRVRKSDGRVSEVAWNEQAETFGNLTHDAVDDGFVPVAGNSQYYNRFSDLALLVQYELGTDEFIPCVLKVAR